MTYYLQAAFNGITWTDGKTQHSSLQAAISECDTIFAEQDESVTIRVKGSDGNSYYRRNATRRASS
jgi:hypothetical protein